MKVQPLRSGDYYHIYNRGNNKENIFLSDDNYIYFLKLLTKYILPISEIYSYCLLPNHFHIILKLKNNHELPIEFKNGTKKIHQPFSNFFNAYTKAFNLKHNRTGSLFQKHLKRKLIDSTDYLTKLIIYINTNPSHHNIADYSTYKHSSFQALISDNSTSIDRDFVISLFGDVENFKYTLKLKKDNLDSIEELTFE